MRRFLLQFALTCVLAGTLLPVWGWDVEHDEVAALVGATLPAEIRSFFTSSDFDVLIAFCHYPDMAERPGVKGIITRWKRSRSRSARKMRRFWRSRDIRTRVGCIGSARVQR